MGENDFKIQELNKLSNYKKVQTIGKSNGKQYIYKYMNAERALEFIANKNLCFVEPSSWNDPYESRFYNADYSNLKSFNQPQRIYSTCTTLNKTSEAAWKVYSYNAKGLASRCVLFKIKRSIFLKQLDDFAVKNEFDFYEGKVNYLFYDSIIKDMHLKDKPFYDIFFNNFNLDKYLNLLLIKRQAFEYENELRYFLINKNKHNDDKIFISFNGLELIDSIWYDNDCSDYEINLIKTVCLNNNLNVPIAKFDLYDYDNNNQIKIDSNN